LHISGLTPDAEAAIVFATRHLEGFAPVATYGAELVRDEDGDGLVSWSPEGGVRALSAWVVIDLSNGEWARAWGERFTGEEEVLPVAAFERGTSGAIEQVGRGGVLYFGALARPGADAARRGLWQGLVGDGEETDGDLASDGRVSFAPRLAEPVGASPAPPEHLEPGDVVVFLDPGRLTLSVGVLPRPGEPGSSRPTTGAGQTR
jgi:hypothetical protein